MKKLLLLLSIISFSNSYSQKWEPLFDSEKGSYYYKANTDDTAWTKLVFEKIEYYSSKTRKSEIVDGYKMTLWKFDCEKKKLGIIQAIVYSKDGKSLDSFSQNEVLVEMNYVIPESIGERLLWSFCEF